MKLAELGCGEQGIIKGFGESADPKLVRRFEELGFTRGAKIEVRHFGPIGKDPIAVEVAGVLFGIGREQAKWIEVQK